MKKSEKNFFKWPLSSIFGILTFLTELLFTLPAMIMWNLNNPTAFNPLVNWHSDLGNIDLNLAGHYFYNSGQVVQAVAIIMFAGGLYLIKNKTKIKSVKSSQIFLILAGIFLMIGGGFFPETNYDLSLIESSTTGGNLSFLMSPHVISSLLLFVCLSIAIGSLVFKLKKIKGYKTVRIIGIVAFVLNILVLPLNMLFSPPVVELFAAISAEIFIASIGIKILIESRK